jgi:chromosome segregation ATPase
MSRSVALVIMTVILAGAAFVARVPAQQQTVSVQTELLAEVRMLRQSIEMLTGVNARVQIVFGRLQLQEQRVEAAAKRLDMARLQASAVMQRLTDATDHIKALEGGINDTRRKPEQIEQMQSELRVGRRELERIEAERLRLTAEETDAAGVLNQEQGRWSDLNRQLDELERILSPRQQ